MRNEASPRGRALKRPDVKTIRYFTSGRFYSHFLILCTSYIIMMLSPPVVAVKGGDAVEILLSFMISVMAGIVANYICKWLNRKAPDNRPED